MQLEFEKQGISCLQTLKREEQSQEQTQEVRISDGMPDIGTIVGAWGQTILRGKEWQSDGISVSGGTMVWVQYLPDEGGEPCTVESWIPFQMRWNFPSTEQDGTILVQCCLRNVDARSTSARKMMLRTNVSVLGWAMEKQEIEHYLPQNIPEDIQLRIERYPVLIPVEAGEKAFSLEENLSLPPSVPMLENVISYTIQPEITEEKLIRDKVVFRGNARVHMLYSADDGRQCGWDFELPFTQYTELDGEYGDEAEVLLVPCVTTLELDREADKLVLKAGIVCQYRVSDRMMIEIVTDAYSPVRSVVPAGQMLELPGILDSKIQMIHAQHNCPVDAMGLVDVQFFPQTLRTRNEEKTVNLEIPGMFQLLYYDMEGKLSSCLQKWEQNVKISAAEGVHMEPLVLPEGNTQGSFMSGSAQLSSGLKLVMHTLNAAGIPMITGLEIGELQEPDPNRPSIILRKVREGSLWDLAKQYGSTETAIREANGLQSEPDCKQMLIIPIL